MASPRTSPHSTTSTLNDTCYSQKLKESCDDCSASKVKCTREKPTCQRCARRGRPCVYAASRRSGRGSVKSFTSFNAGLDESNNSSNSTNSTKEQQNDTWLDAMTSALTADAMMNAFTNDQWFPRPVSWSEQTSPDFASTSVPLWADLGPSREGEQGDASSLSGLRPESCLSPNAAAILDIDMISDGATAWTKPSGPELLYVDSAPVAPVAPMAPMLPPPSEPLATHGCNNLNTHDTCLATATKLMLSLFPQNSSPGAACLSFDAVLRQNRRAIDVATAVVNCQCSKDGYLASILSLILLKTMAWYAAVVKGDNSHIACEPESAAARRGQHIGMGGEMVQRDEMAHDSETQEERRAARVIMGELHHVQRLLKLLSSRLGDRSLQQGLSDSGISISDASILSCNSEEDYIGTSQLSQSMLNRLDAEIRGRFRAVSSATIERLRII